MPKKAKSTGFAARLKTLREIAGLTQDELAEKAGLYKFSIAKIEQGIREPTWATVQALCTALDVDCTAFDLRAGSVRRRKTPRGRPRKE
jgi:transcriptional regulator with XRE-family HTH domain